MVAAALNDHPDLRIYSRPCHKFQLSPRRSFRRSFHRLSNTTIIGYNNFRITYYIMYIRSSTIYKTYIYTRGNGSKFQTRSFIQNFSPFFPPSSGSSVYIEPDRLPSVASLRLPVSVLVSQSVHRTLSPLSPDGASSVLPAAPLPQMA